MSNPHSREESGLTEEEIGQCSLLCAIPTGRLQPSMNLSHAVAVVLSHIFALQGDGQDRVFSAAAQAGPAFAIGALAAQRAVQPAVLGEVEALVQRLDVLGEAVDFHQQGYVALNVVPMALAMCAQRIKTCDSQGSGTAGAGSAATQGAGTCPHDHPGVCGFLTMLQGRQCCKERAIAMRSQEVRTLHSLVTAIEARIHNL